MNKAPSAKKHFILLLLIIAGVFCSVNQAIAQTSLVIKALQSNDDINMSEQDLRRERYLKRMLACRGIRMAHTEAKVIALTFDDGPHGRYTPQVLNILKKYDIKATFFVLGENVADYPEILKRTYQDGHTIAMHSYDHQFLPKLSENAITENLTNNSQVIYKTIGLKPLLFRPPYGQCSVESRNAVKTLDLKTIMWSSSSDDYLSNRITAQKIASDIISLAGPGGIIMLHDGGGDRHKTVQALPVIIETLQGNGYKFLTVNELLGFKPYAEAETPKEEQKPEDCPYTLNALKIHQKPI